MSQAQFYQQKQQWAELDDEAERIERANAALQEMTAARDEEFRKEIEAKYPILKGWK